MEKKTAYDEGFAARQRGEPKSANPYQEPKDRLDWGTGWRDLDHHLNERDAALESIGWFG